MSNQNISDAGKATRFQRGNTAAKDRATKTSFQNYVREIAEWDLDPAALKSGKDFDTAVESYLTGPTPTQKLMAIALLKKAFRGNTASIQRIERIVNGPESASGQPSLADLVAEARSELRREEATAKVSNNSPTDSEVI